MASVGVALSYRGDFQIIVLGTSQQQISVGHHQLIESFRKLVHFVLELFYVLAQLPN